eukprot:CAMPEP_0115071816 /NCGR_PEP_ID=MMETSP0227-20121206/13885_1 /TAXON_ID=89957 /ORGANISM="Polarella glacialis, Strain CCMP 1383" /LENGTH=35 /DNA_ID= /DNA_START= /DNA_END= /DNA_ORIENTATION=
MTSQLGLRCMGALLLAVSTWPAAMAAGGCSENQGF